MDISQYIYNNDIQGLKSFLDTNPVSANAEIALPGQDGPTAHVLHRLCDAVFCHMIDEDSAVRMAELLIEAGTSVDGNLPAEGRDTPLIAAASLYTDKLGSLYIKHGANLSHKGTYGGTALHWAAWCGRSALVGELLEAGAPVNQLCNDFKGTPLLWAAHGFRTTEAADPDVFMACMKMLLEAGANKSIPNVDGDTPAQMAGTTVHAMAKLLG